MALIVTLRPFFRLALPNDYTSHMGKSNIGHQS